MKVRRICKQCKEEFEIASWKVKRGEGIFCSYKCMGRWQSQNATGEKSRNWKGGKVKRICKFCGITFLITPARIRQGGGHFCSRKCSFKWQSKRKKEDHPSWKGGKIEQICKVCGKRFWVYPYRIKNGWGNYCSYSCSRKVRGIPKHHTKPELIFEGICEKNNLPFKYVGDGSLWIGKERKLNPDFIEANGKKICIEVFGDYWHSPLLNWKNMEISRTYEYRKRELKSYGWKVIVFWESDLLRDDVEEFVLKKMGDT